MDASFRFCRDLRKNLSYGVLRCRATLARSTVHPSLLFTTAPAPTRLFGRRTGRRIIGGRHGYRTTRREAGSYCAAMDSPVLY